MVVGHPKVTERAYASSVEQIERARNFAIAAVPNGLGPKHPLSREQELRLLAQLERDFLVAITNP